MAEGVMGVADWQAAPAHVPSPIITVVCSEGPVCHRLLREWQSGRHLSNLPRPDALTGSPWGTGRAAGDAVGRRTTTPAQRATSQLVAPPGGVASARPRPRRGRSCEW